MIQWLSPSFLEVSYNQPDLCPSATWNPMSVTFANSSIVGTDVLGLFINKNNTIYVAERNLSQVQSMA